MSEISEKGLGSSSPRFEIKNDLGRTIEQIIKAQFQRK